MSSVALHFASGAAFFTGAVFLLAGLFVVTNARGKLPSALGRMSLVAGLFCVVMSATPLPLWAWCVWGAGFVFWAGSLFASPSGPQKWRAAALLAFVGCTLAAFFWELDFQLPPRPVRGRWNRLVVIGDSLSAVDFTDGGEPWPTLIARDGNIEVVNLAFSGASANSVQKRVSPEDVAGALVLVEIGGNDVLGWTSPAEFEKHLDRLLTKVCRSDNAVVMLELPLPPLCNGFGASQRRLARRHHVLLIPKRYFAGVLAGQDATIDSLHFSPAGHQRMANLVRRFLLPARGSPTHADVGARRP